jgi:hypothetical protein
LCINSTENSQQAREGNVTDDDVTFMANLTNNYRLNWGDSKNIVGQEGVE